jgi:tRNA threonylcarbamoyladenosine biosynthesis protein TsaE
MNFPLQKIVDSEDSTSKVASEFARILSDGDVILLDGHLGAGKTFFVKNICKIFEIDNVTSPSFALVNEYHGSKNIIHIDFYRIKKIEELYDIGINDYLSNVNSIVFIEWANMYPEILPKKNYLVQFKVIENLTREIRISKNE